MDELEPLTRLSGVRFVALVTEDGVPVPVTAGDPQEADRLAAVAQQFLSELVQSTAPLTWGPPRWARVTSDRGGLCLMRVRGGALMVLFGSDADPSGMKLPMRAAAERVERTLDRLGAGASELDRTAPALPDAVGAVDRVPADSVTHDEA